MALSTTFHVGSQIPETSPRGRNRNTIYANSKHQQGEVIKMNIQVKNPRPKDGVFIVKINHLHTIAMIPPKVTVSKYVGRLKGKSAIRNDRMFSNIQYSAVLLFFEPNVDQARCHPKQMNRTTQTVFPACSAFFNSFFSLIRF